MSDRSYAPYGTSRSPSDDKGTEYLGAFSVGSRASPDSVEAFRRVRRVGSSGLTIWGPERVKTRLHNGDRRPDEPPDARASLFWNSAADVRVGPLLLNVWMVTSLRNVHRSTTKGRLLSYPAKGPCHE
jgi:hypothetical protein